ncbi:MAG: hypothetical protein ACRD6W_05665 [Nitrososphaerales archaeon]
MSTCLFFTPEEPPYLSIYLSKDEPEHEPVDEHEHGRIDADSEVACEGGLRDVGHADGEEVVAADEVLCGLEELEDLQDVEGRAESGSKKERYLDLPLKRLPDLR